MSKQNHTIFIFAYAAFCLLLVGWMIGRIMGKSEAVGELLLVAAKHSEKVVELTQNENN